MSPITITSRRSVWYRATLVETDEGVRVEIRQRLAGGGLTKLLHTDILPCPLHIARDRVQELLDQLDPPAKTRRAR